MVLLGAPLLGGRFVAGSERHQARVGVGRIPPDLRSRSDGTEAMVSAGSSSSTPEHRSTQSLKAPSSTPEEGQSG